MEKLAEVTEKAGVSRHGKEPLPDALCLGSPECRLHCALQHLAQGVAHNVVLTNAWIPVQCNPLLHPGPEVWFT